MSPPFFAFISCAFLITFQRLNSAFEQVTDLYSNFIGMQHFRCIVRLVHYKGINIIIEELLKIVKASVRLHNGLLYDTIDHNLDNGHTYMHL